MQKEQNEECYATSLCELLLESLLVCVYCTTNGDEETRRGSQGEKESARVRDEGCAEYNRHARIKVSGRERERRGVKAKTGLKA